MKIIYKKIRCCVMLYLIFCFPAGCSETQKNDQSSLSVKWEGNKAVAIIIPGKLLASTPEDSVELFLHVHLKGQVSQSNILGKYIVTTDSTVFRPLIAFTRGLKYDVYLKDKLLGEVSIPPADVAGAPSVLAVYPGGDTLPENLLKIHIGFSKPMQEGQALQHVLLIKDGRDTLPAVFLDLQPELWSNDRMTLTLWFDPGRIKRDLQPNIKMGPPLRAGRHYQLVISRDWPGADGSLLTASYRKDFVTVSRDQQSPDIDSWTIKPPASGSTGRLEADFNEPLDYVLIKNAVFVVDARGNTVKGTMDIKKGETGFSFLPAAAWQPGTYAIECESRMEDLAGNNMNRLFDTDLASETMHQQKEIFRKKFYIK